MDFIPVNEPLLNGNEKKYLTECVDTGWISSEGPFVKRLEDQMKEITGRNYASAVSNGSVALDLALEVLDLPSGSEVIMPAFTIISCIIPLIKRGLVPVLADADINTWNMDVSQLESLITPKTSAIMVVHIYGLPVDMDPVIELAQKHGLKIIEDSAQAHGLYYKDRPCGGFGDISCMSFYPNKHVTTGEGGMVLMDNEELYKKSEYFKNLCHKPGFRFVHEDLGFNYRMSNIQAAVGVAQAEVLKEHLEFKRKMGERYQELFSDVQRYRKPLSSTEYTENVYWVFGLVLPEDDDRSAIDFMKWLGERGIGCRPFFCPMNRQPALHKRNYFKDLKMPVADYLYDKGFYIPGGLALKPEQIERVGELVREAARVL